MSAICKSLEDTQKNIKYDGDSNTDIKMNSGDTYLQKNHHRIITTNSI